MGFLFGGPRDNGLSPYTYSPALPYHFGHDPYPYPYNNSNPYQQTAYHPYQQTAQGYHPNQSYYPNQLPYGYPFYPQGTELQANPIHQPSYNPYSQVNVHPYTNPVAPSQYSPYPPSAQPLPYPIVRDQIMDGQTYCLEHSNVPAYQASIMR